MTNWLHGVDISHYQYAPWVPWAEIGRTSQFAMVKLSEGRTPDPRAAELVARVREQGMHVGGYHFWRESVPLPDQIDTFGAIAAKCGIGKGDIVPALDLEKSRDGYLTQAANAGASGWCETMAKHYGDVLVYLAQIDWASRLGSPDWPFAYSLWVPHWKGHPSAGPATPGHRAWRIWQYAVHPYAPASYRNDATNPHALDHNWALDPLPLIGEGVVASRSSGHVSPIHWVTAVDWQEWQAGRDRIVQGQDGSD